MWVRPIAEADSTCGAKASNLARLIAAGLPVPDGFVIDDGAFRFVVGELPAERDEIGHAVAHVVFEEAAPPELVDDVSQRAAALGVVAVRSSASLEDAASGSAAGVFASITNVAARDVWPAIRAVWTSALAPLAATYARGRPFAMSVIVQRFVPGDRITVYTRAPGAPQGGKIVVQRGDYVRDYARDDIDPIVAIALRAEHAIRAADGADVELVETKSGELWVVQARPIVHPPPITRVPPPPALLGALVADGRRWTWDVAHNPDPLSPAQAGLVERIERAQVAPWSLRVAAGYLYSAPRVEPAEVTVEDAADLEARAAALEADFERILDMAAPSVDDAIERYVAFYARWSMEMVPLIAAGRRSAGEIDPTQIVGARSSAVEATILAAARGDLDEESAITQLAPLAPTWDVAVPTFGERPEIIRAAIARARNLVIDHDSKKRTGPFSEKGTGPFSENRTGPFSENRTGPFSENRTGPDSDKHALARAVANLAERDDIWFARAQHLVRSALLRRAAETGVSTEDICWLSLEEKTGRAVFDSVDLDEVRRRASAARAAHRRASTWAIPLVVGGEVEETRPRFHGFGSDARVSGRVVRFESLASAIAVGRGDVIVARAITPALAVFVIGCAAIISETGGPLDHGAAIARELGIPFVVGCRDAWSLLRDGMLVTIDGSVVIV